MWNFKEPAARLIEHGAAGQVMDAEELEMIVNRLLADANERARMGAAARAFVELQHGATEKTVRLFDDVLTERRTRTAAA